MHAYAGPMMPRNVPLSLLLTGVLVCNVVAWVLVVSRHDGVLSSSGGSGDEVHGLAVAAAGGRRAMRGSGHASARVPPGMQTLALQTDIGSSSRNSNGGDGSSSSSAGVLVGGGSGGGGTDKDYSAGAAGKGSSVDRLEGKLVAVLGQPDGGTDALGSDGQHTHLDVAGGTAGASGGEGAGQASGDGSAGGMTAGGTGGSNTAGGTATDQIMQQHDQDEGGEAQQQSSQGHSDELPGKTGEEGAQGQGQGHEEVPVERREDAAAGEAGGEAAEGASNPDDRAQAQQQQEQQQQQQGQSQQGQQQQEQQGQVQQEQQQQAQQGQMQQGSNQALWQSLNVRAEALQRLQEVQERLQHQQAHATTKQAAAAVRVMQRLQGSEELAQHAAAALAKAGLTPHERKPKAGPRPGPNSTDWPPVWWFAPFFDRTSFGKEAATLLLGAVR